MGFLSKLIKGAVNTALLPIDVVSDVVTMGGALTDKDEPYSVTRIKKAVESIEDAAEDAGNGEIL